MELKEGYKQTEVGLIPNDWVVKIIEEIAEVKSGKRLPLGYHLTEKETPYPYIRVADMFEGGVFLGDIKYVPESVYPAIKNYRIFKGDIFISVAGTLGIVGRIPDALDGANLTENADRLTNINCDRDYLLFVLMSSLIQYTIESERTLGAQPKLALTRIRKFQIPLPPTKVEQTAIATALSDADALIQSLEKFIAKKRNIKQGAMQELLTGKKRLAGFEGDWQEYELNELGIFKGGSGFPTKYQGRIEGEFPFYKVSDMNIEGNEVFMSNSNNYINEDIKKLTNTFIFPKNTIVFAKIGAAVFLERKKILTQESCIDNNMMGFILNATKCDINFFHSLFLSVKLSKLVSTTALPSLNGKEIGQLKFKIPKPEEQTAIATILSDIDAEIAALETKLAKYKQIKQGMMQELLTGRTRLV